MIAERDDHLAGELRDLLNAATVMPAAGVLGTVTHDTGASE